MAKKKKAKKKVNKKAKKKTAKKKTTKKATKKKATKKKAAKKKAAKKKAAKKKTKKKATKKKPAVNSGGKVSIGKSVPNFSLEANGGKTFNLDDYKGKKLVIYFYPKDMTPGCTVEGKDFSCMKQEFNKANAEVFGVSRDSVKSHEKFIEKEDYTIDLLSDPDEKACDIFGVMKNKKLYGREYRGIDRSTFVIDEDGKLIGEWRGVKVPGHADEVLKFIKGIILV